MKKRQSYYERFMAMTDAERDKEVEPFDTEDLTPGKPLTKAGRQVHRIARLRGRPQVGKGAQRVLISMEKSLLAETDKAAKRTGVSRSQLIADALRTVLGRAG